MNNYRVWKCDNDEELLIEIFNEEDLLSVQQEFANKGYIIIRCDYAFGEAYLKVVKEME